MKILLRIFILAVVLAPFGTAAENRFAHTSRSALGDVTRVFEIVGGEASVGSPFLKRIEVGKESAIFTVRNDTQKTIAPKITAEFFNLYGMRICVVEGSFGRDAVKPGGVGVKQLALTFPDLEVVFKKSTIQLPADWRELRFVRVEVTPVDNSKASDSPIDPSRIAPRPPITNRQAVRPAILAERLAGTPNIGPTAVDARWSNYGAYLQKMMETLQIQWERLLTESKVYPSSGSTVSVKFVLDSKGRVTRIANVDSTANEAATNACISAITNRAPFSDWTDDMKVVLGERQEMTFTFYYQ